MNQSEFYTQWLSALRSGKYGQGRRFLSADGEFCCLGVACDVLSENGEGEWHLSEGGHINYFHINSQKDSSVLPSRVQEYLGMSAAGDFEIPGGGYFDRKAGRHFIRRTALTELNDDGFTFDQIADVIEYFFAPKAV